MRDRFVHLALNQLYFTNLIPDNLNLNNAYNHAERQKYNDLIQLHFSAYEEDSDVLRNLSTLLNKAVLSILDKMEVYENNLYLIIEDQAKDENNLLRKAQLNRLISFYNTIKSKRNLNDTMRETVLKRVAVNASGMIDELKKREYVSLYDDSVKKLLMSGMSYALKIRKELIKAYPLPLQVNLKLPKKAQLKNFMENSVKTVWSIYNNRKWASIYFNLSAIIKTEDEKPAVPDEEWQQFKNAMLSSSLAFYTKGDILFAGNYREQAFLHYQEALRIALQINPESLPVMKCYVAIADTYNQRGIARDVLLASFFYKKAKKLFNKIKVSETNKDELYNELFACLVKLGTLYFERGLIEKENAKCNDSIQHAHDLRMKGGLLHQDMIALCQNMYGMNHSKVADCYTDLALHYASLKQYKFAKRYDLKALQIYELDANNSATRKMIARIKNALVMYNKLIPIYEHSPTLSISFADMQVTNQDDEGECKELSRVAHHHRATFRQHEEPLTDAETKISTVSDEKPSLPQKEVTLTPPKPKPMGILSFLHSLNSGQQRAVEVPCPSRELSPARRR